MARPAKTRLDYYPLYCDYDDRIEFLIAVHGFEGYGIYISLLNKIYGGKGYYMNWDNKTLHIFSSSGKTDSQKTKDVVECLLDEGIFNREIYEKYSVLTSKEIQENYLYAVSKRTHIVIEEHLKLVFPEETPVFSSESTQRKENKIKENNRIEEGEIVEETPPSPSPVKARGEFNNVMLTEEEYDALSTEFDNLSLLIERLSQYMAASGKSYANHYAVLKKWAREDKAKECASPPSAQKKAKEENSSYDIDEFFALALAKSNEKMLKAYSPPPK